jgi:hypothetical protein
MQVLTEFVILAIYILLHSDFTLRSTAVQVLSLYHGQIENRN